MTTNELKNFAKVRNKKPKMILCCDISIRNELAIGHESGDISLWKLDITGYGYNFLALLNIDSMPIKQIEFNTLASKLSNHRLNNQ